MDAIAAPVHALPYMLTNATKSASRQVRLASSAPNGGRSSTYNRRSSGYNRRRSYRRSSYRQSAYSQCS